LAAMMAPPPQEAEKPETPDRQDKEILDRSGNP